MSNIAVHYLREEPVATLVAAGLVVGSIGLQLFAWFGWPAITFAGIVLLLLFLFRSQPSASRQMASRLGVIGILLSITHLLTGSKR
ncbi:hypothetical protein [Chthonobacter albigriseus]|uniref:hypothetical protein n=1 Tax=Chthonobacter albigriseus TaxID=1683161 RepID=UPI0015EF879B|nr:hypothetical protein [Chthonobacter albigriseus]